MKPSLNIIIYLFYFFIFLIIIIIILLLSLYFDRGLRREKWDIFILSAKD